MIKKGLIFLSLVVLSCNSNKWRNIEIISPNYSDTISIVTIENKRYIYNGNSDKIPDKHVLLDISNVAKLSDEIGICWDKDGYKWKLSSFDSDFKYNDLDTSRFYVQEKVLLDDNCIPDYEEYFKEGCVVIYPRSEIIRPKNGAILLFK